MSHFHRLLLVCLTSTFTFGATSCAASPQRAQPIRIHPAWEIHMAAGLDATDIGDHASAYRHFQRAVAVARNERLPDEELAFSIYRLGEEVRTHPDAARDEDALDLLHQARRHFDRAYGPKHPVLMPVWVRIATIQEERGNTEGAAESRVVADEIALHSFPESHFLRERFGAARPASMLHPLEVLHLIATDAPAEETGDSGRVVQGASHTGAAAGVIQGPSPGARAQKRSSRP
jgi:hypothetical protein